MLLLPRPPELASVFVAMNADANEFGYVDFLYTLIRYRDDELACLVLLKLLEPSQQTHLCYSLYEVLIWEPFFFTVVSSCATAATASYSGIQKRYFVTLLTLHLKLLRQLKMMRNAFDPNYWFSDQCAIKKRNKCVCKQRIMEFLDFCIIAVYYQNDNILFRVVSEDLRKQYRIDDCNHTNPESYHYLELQNGIVQQSINGVIPRHMLFTACGCFCTGMAYHATERWFLSRV